MGWMRNLGFLEVGLGIEEGGDDGCGIMVEGVWNSKI